MSISKTAARPSSAIQTVNDAPASSERLSVGSPESPRAPGSESPLNALSEPGRFVAVPSSSGPRHSSSSEDDSPVEGRPAAAGISDVRSMQAAKAALRGTAIGFIMALSKPDGMDREVHGPQLKTAADAAKEAIHKAVAAGASPAEAVKIFKAAASKYAETLDVKALHRTEGGLEWLEKHLFKDPVARQLGKAVIELDLLGLWEAKKNSERKDNPNLKNRALAPWRAVKGGVRDIDAKLHQSSVKKKNAALQANELLVQKALAPALKLTREAPPTALAASLNKHFAETLEPLITPDQNGNSQIDMFVGFASDLLFAQDRDTLEAFADALSSVTVAFGPKATLIQALQQTVATLLELGATSEAPQTPFAELDRGAKALVNGLITSIRTPESAGDVEDMILGLEVEITKLSLQGVVPRDAISAFKESFDQEIATRTSRDVKHAVQAASDLEQHKSDMDRTPTNRLIVSHLLETLDRFDNKNNERAPARQALAQERDLKTPATRPGEKLHDGALSAVRALKGAMRTTKVNAARSDDLSVFHRSQAEDAINALIHALDNPDEGNPMYASATFNRALGGPVWRPSEQDDAAMTTAQLKVRLEEALLEFSPDDVARIANMLFTTAVDRAMKDGRLDALRQALATTLEKSPGHGALAAALSATTVTGNN